MGRTRDSNALAVCRGSDGPWSPLVALGAADHKPLPPGVEEGTGGDSFGGGEVAVAEVAEVVDQGHGPVRVRALDEGDRKTRSQQAFLENAAVPAGTAGRGDAGGETGQVPATFDLGTGVTRSLHPNLGITDG